jgi:hypothetical protein
VVSYYHIILPYHISHIILPQQGFPVFFPDTREWAVARLDGDLPSGSQARCKSRCLNFLGSEEFPPMGSDRVHGAARAAGVARITPEACPQPLPSRGRGRKSLLLPTSKN